MRGGFLSGVTDNEYLNEIETDRHLVRMLAGGRTGASEGLTIEPHSVSLAMNIDPGLAVVGGDIARGSYLCWEDDVETVAWPAPDAQARVDALVLAVGDQQYGALGTEMTEGPQWLVVTGAPAGSPAAPSDSDIDTAVGAGSWERWADVRIDPTDTTIAEGNITRYNPSIDPEEAVDPFASASRSTGQGIATDTETVVQLTAVDAETHAGMVSTASNRINIPKTGWYHVSFGVDYNANANGQRNLYLLRNGSKVPFISTRHQALGGSGVSGGGHMVRCDGYVRCNTNDTLQLGTWHDLGSTINIDAAQIQACWVRP